MGIWALIKGNIWSKLAMIMLVSMAPVVELRGAIPLAAAHGVPLWLAVTVSVVGNMIPVPFIIIFLRKFLNFIRYRIPKLDGLVTKFEKKIEKKAKKIKKCSAWGLFLLVAIPLPGTGAWTGAMIAAVLDFRIKDALPAIFLGVIAAGLLVGLATGGVIHFVF